MRYYVLCDGDVHAPPHIVAEVVHDAGESGADRCISFGSPLIAARSALVTGDELRGTRQGRTALDAWDGRDDSVFDSETERLAAAPDDDAPRLRVVRS